MTIGISLWYISTDMWNKPSHTPKRNIWGDEHPEKLTEGYPKTIGLTDQLKGLSPDKMLSQLLGNNAGYENISPKGRERTRSSNETVIFSHVHKKEEVHMQQETEIILQKLKEQVTLLEKSEYSFVAEVSKIKVERVPKKTGIYYIRFLEWLLLTVKQLRLKVDEGRAWLAEFNQKKKKRIGYWQMYKKHGTTFGLSHERTLATQTG